MGGDAVDVTPIPQCCEWPGCDARPVVVVGRYEMTGALLKSLAVCPAHELAAHQRLERP